MRSGQIEDKCAVNRRIKLEVEIIESLVSSRNCACLFRRSSSRLLRQASSSETSVEIKSMGAMFPFALAEGGFPSLPPCRSAAVVPGRD